MTAVDDRVGELVARFSAADACLADLLCDQHDPDATAFTLVHDDLSIAVLTYCELRERSERVAAGLAELGVSAGDAVATLMGKSADYLATVMGSGGWVRHTCHCSPRSPHRRSRCGSTAAAPRWW